MLKIFYTSLQNMWYDFLSALNFMSSFIFLFFWKLFIWSVVLHTSLQYVLIEEVKHEFIIISKKAILFQTCLCQQQLFAIILIHLSLGLSMFQILLYFLYLLIPHFCKTVLLLRLSFLFYLFDMLLYHVWITDIIIC